MKIHFIEQEDASERERKANKGKFPVVGGAELFQLSVQFSCLAQEFLALEFFSLPPRPVGLAKQFSVLITRRAVCQSWHVS